MPQDFRGNMRRQTVICPKCQKEFFSDEIEITDISEDFQGYDVVTFECPKCKESVESWVRC